MHNYVLYLPVRQHRVGNIVTCHVVEYLHSVRQQFIKVGADTDLIDGSNLTVNLLQ